MSGQQKEKSEQEEVKQSPQSLTVQEGRFQFWNEVMRRVCFTIFCGTGNILVKALHLDSHKFSYEWNRRWKFQFPSIRVPNSSYCTSQLPSLETQPPTYLQQVPCVPQAPAAFTQTCSWVAATPCCVDEIHMHTCTKSVWSWKS